MRLRRAMEGFNYRLVEYVYDDKKCDLVNRELMHEMSLESCFKLISYPSMD